MGTTLTIAWLLHGTVSWVNVGDSRLYRMRDQYLELLTLDQTRNEFLRRDSATVTPADGNHLAQNFIYGSRGLGNNAGLRLEPGLDSGTLPLKPGDVLVLCTDGLWGFVDPEDIVDALLTNPDPSTAARVLNRAAMAGGSPDNITTLIVVVEDAAPPVVEWTDDFDALRSSD
jgi:protein phosphatase